MQVDLHSILGIVVSVLLAVLTGQVRGNRKDTKDIGTTLNAHILSMTEKLATKVDVTGCKGIRAECIDLNKQIIVGPLEKAFQDIEMCRKDAWERQRQENRAMWAAIRTHAHTELPNREKDKVIITLPANGTA